MRLILVVLALFAAMQTHAGINEWTYVGLAPEQVTAVAVHPTNPDIIYASALDVFWDDTREGGLFKTYDHGLTWDTLGFRHQNVMDVAIDPNNPETVWMVAEDYGAWRSMNGGLAWEELDDGMILNSMANTGPRAIRICPQDPQRLLVASGNWDGWGAAYFSEDGGATWQDAEYSAGDRISHAQFDPLVPGLAWLGRDIGEGIWMSVDTGRTFTRMNPDSNRGGVEDLQVTSRPGVMAYTTGGIITATVDSGQTWYDLPVQFFPDTIITTVAPIGLCDTMAIGTDHGVFLTLDGGESLTLLGSNGSSLITWQMWTAPGDSLKFLAVWSGLWECTYLDTSTSIRFPHRTRDVPDDQSIQIYPNPAASRVWVTLTGDRCRGRLTLYNLVGQTVAAFSVTSSSEATFTVDLPKFLTTGRYYFAFRQEGLDLHQPTIFCVTILR